MDKFRFGLHLLGGIAIAAGLGGCADESPWGSSSGEKGTLDITLSTDSSFDTAKPLFRSGEETTTNDLSKFLTIPTQDKFTFTLHKSGSEEDPISWTDKDQKVAAGSYDLIAHYGTKGKQGFNSPYFEAKSAITILPGRATSVNLSAELKNSMVQIVYTKEFQNYMSDYAVSLRTEGLTDIIEFPSKNSSSGTTPTDATEDKISEIAFVETNNAQIFIGFTTKNTGITVPSYSLGEFAPVAKTLYRITLDVTERETGIAQLKVSFDERMPEEDRYIDLTEELLTSAEPKITPEGFSDGESINVLDYTEASNKTLKMTVFAQGGLESATLTITGPESPLSTWSNEINLVGASEPVKTALSSAGIEATTFFGTLASTNTLAELDLTGFCQKLANGSFAKGVYEASLLVKDKTGKTDDISFSLDSNDIQLSPAAETDLQTIDYDSDEVVLMLDYNGESENDINFKYVDGSEEKVIENVKIERIVVAEKPATRAYSKYRYQCTIPLPEAAKKSSITIKAYYPGGSKTFDFNVKVPGYKLEYDAFAHYAYIKIVPDSNDDLNTILKNITYTLNNNPITPQTVSGYNNVFLITGLSSSPENGTDYTLQSSITTDTKTAISFTSEKEKAIPNGDFSTPDPNNLSCDYFQVGGRWYLLKGTYYTNISKFDLEVPKDWLTINDITASKKSTYNDNNSNYTQNSWYVVPSSWLKDGQGYMRNVGYSLNGKKINDYNTSGANYYSRNTPDETDLDKAAGELSYTNNSFPSRPTSIIFDYTYKSILDDKGEILVSISNSNGEIISKSEVITSGKDVKGKKIPLVYPQFKQSDTYKLSITFRSSNQGSDAPITIPKGTSLDEFIPVSTGKTKTIDTNEYHAFAMGSELWIDNVTALYEDEPITPSSSSPKPKATKKRK